MSKLCIKCRKIYNSKYEFCTKCGKKLIKINIINIIYLGILLFTFICISMCIIFVLFIPKNQDLNQVDNGYFINSNGKIIFQLPKEYNLVGMYNEGYIVVGTKKQDIQIKQKEKDYIFKHPGMLAELTIFNNKGLPTGKIPFDVILDVNHDFIPLIPIVKNGYIIVHDGKNYRLINTKGNEIKNKDIYKALLDNENVIFQYDDGVIIGYRIEDKDGNILYQTSKTTKYKFPRGRFSDGLLLVSNKQLFEESGDLAYVDKNGNVVVEIPSYSSADVYHYYEYWTKNSDFHNGLAFLYNSAGEGVYINKQGKVIINSKSYHFQSPFVGKLASVTSCTTDRESYIINSCNSAHLIDINNNIVYSYVLDNNNFKQAYYESDYEDTSLKEYTITKDDKLDRIITQYLID